MKCNLQQEMAIKTINGPVLVIAGPGTGKTFTLVERVIYMISELNIDPSEIMITTFTNKAALELLDRLSLEFKKKNLIKDVNDMMLGNFHSVARKILDKYIDYTCLKRGYITIDDIDQLYLIDKNIELFRKIPGYSRVISSKREAQDIKDVVNRICEEAILERKSEDEIDSIIFNILDLYEKIMKRYNMIDFSHTLYYTYKLLAENKCVRDEVKNNINYIMIDEYQDTNKVQEKIIFEILNDNNNICVVGDDDQALYRFRGSSVKNILEFNKIFENTKVIKLMHNYRSEDSIIKFYSNYLTSFIEDNPELKIYRYNKLLFSDRISENKRVVKIEEDNEEQWIISIYNYIDELLKTDSINSLNEIAILFSSVNDSKALKLISYLKSKDINVYIPKTNTLLSNKEVLRIIGALYTIFKPLINKYVNYFDRDTQEFLENVYEDFYKVSLKDEELLEYIANMSNYIQSKKFQLTLYDVIYRLIAYKPFIKYMQIENKAKKISRFIELNYTFQLINQLYYINESNVKKFVNEYFYSFIKFIKDKKIPEFHDDTKIPDKNTISVLTIHASKGMEYPVVIMASLWDYIGKPYKSKLKKIIEDVIEKYSESVNYEPEEYMNSLDYYRKNYTGFSRAKDLLVLAALDSKFRGVSKEYKNILKHLEVLRPKDLNIKKGKSKENKIKRKYSFTTDIVTYNKCPLFYYYKNKLKFKELKSKALFYGSIVHESIEFVNNEIINKKPLYDEKIRKVTTEIARQKFISGAVMLTKEDVDKAIKEVLDYKKDIINIGNPLASELGIILSKESYILNGNVDMIYEKNGKKHIIDFKTGTPIGEKEDSNLLKDYFNQINLYAYLYNKTKNEKISTMSLYFTDSRANKKLYTFEYNEEENNKILDMIDNTIKSIEDEDFSKKGCVDKYSLLRFFMNKLNNN